MIKKILPNTVLRNVFWVSLLTLVESLQFLIVLVLAYSFVPIPLDAITEGTAPQLLKLFQPEREVSFYRVWVFVSLAAQVFLLWFWRARINGEQLHRSLKPLVIVDAIWVFLQVFAAFKIIQHGDPSWARGLLYGAMALSLLSRIFWAEILQLWPKRDKYFSWINRPWALPVFLGALAIAGLWIFDGNINADRRVIALSILYYAWVYIVLKEWLGSKAIAACAVLVMVKVQLFNLAMAPSPWMFPDRTPLAHWPDVFIFAFILSQVKKNVRMGAAAGISLAVIVFMFQGIPFHPEYFKTQGQVSFFSSLHHRQFFAFSMSVMLPFVFMAAVIPAFFRVALRSFRLDDIFMLAFGVYGLLCYAHFAGHAYPFGFYWSPLAMIAILSFWVTAALKLLPPSQVFAVKFTLLAISAGALLTNAVFVAYPNLLKFIYHS